MQEHEAAAVAPERCSEGSASDYGREERDARHLSIGLGIAAAFDDFVRMADELGDHQKTP
jgi:hypothetical protein